MTAQMCKIKTFTSTSNNTYVYLFVYFTGEECYCRDWHGCIMAQSIVGLENVQPYKFSECSRSDYNSALRTGRGICLLNKPNEVSTICFGFLNFPVFNALHYINELFHIFYLIPV